MVLGMKSALRHTKERLLFPDCSHAKWVGRHLEVTLRQGKPLLQRTACEFLKCFFAALNLAHLAFCAATIRRAEGERARFLVVWDSPVTFALLLRCASEIRNRQKLILVQSGPFRPLPFPSEVPVPPTCFGPAVFPAFPPAHTDRG